jgi:hypothetical protein
MSTVEIPTFGRTRFHVAPHHSVSVGNSRLVWVPDCGPTLLDPASAAILDSFEGRLTPLELGDDLCAVFGLDPAVAKRSATQTSHNLRLAGLLLADGQEPAHSDDFHYPNDPST